MSGISGCESYECIGCFRVLVEQQVTVSLFVRLVVSCHFCRMASVGLDQTGCHWLSTHRDTTYCYVVEPVNCEGVIPSLDYIGAGFRQCNVTEDPEGVMNDEPVLSVLEIIEGTPQLCTFAEALRAANLSDTLEEGNWTIFAPHNNAFRMFFDSTGETKESLLASPGLAKLLRAHIAPGTCAFGSMQCSAILELFHVVGSFVCRHLYRESPPELERKWGRCGDAIFSHF